MGGVELNSFVKQVLLLLSEDLTDVFFLFGKEKSKGDLTDKFASQAHI
jgi:hypothetical protein